MEEVSGKPIVFYGEPFWVGVFECVSDGKLSACKDSVVQSQRTMRYMILF